MRTAEQNILFLILALFGWTACKQKPANEIRNDFKQYYERFQVEGSFVLYNQKEDKFIFYHPEQTTQTFSPASTFKIFNTLIGLETGVILDENMIIHWDSIIRQNPSWNCDQDLKTAFKNSTVWYYQELARRVGGKQMKYWLDQAKYGNADTAGGIDKFWLSGGLRISPQQQIDFLKRLHNKQLPFSQRSMDIVKDMMVVKDTLGYILRAKAGWGSEGKKDLGWYVGYLETPDNIYYFANCIQSADLNNKDFAHARMEIAELIFADLKIREK